jgi:hypothetical protein
MEHSCLPLTCNPCSALGMHLDLGPVGAAKTLFISCSGYATAVIQELLVNNQCLREIKLVDEESGKSREFIKIYRLFPQDAIVLTVAGTLCIEDALLLEAAIKSSIQFVKLILLETVFSCEHELGNGKDLIDLKGTQMGNNWPELSISELGNMLLAGIEKDKVQLLVCILENYLGNTSFSANGLAELCAVLGKGEQKDNWTVGLFEEGLGQFDQAKFIAKSKAKGYRAMYV